MSRFLFPEWTETLKKWVNLLVMGAPVYLVALIANHLLSAVDAFASVRLIQAAGGEMRVSASIPIR